MKGSGRQTQLSPEQLQAFYHTDFINDQVRHFGEMLGPSDGGLVLDIGGGCGFFAKGLQESWDYSTRVLEMDPQSIDACRALGVDAYLGDALDPKIQGDEHVVAFNLILHHLVGKNETETRSLQLKALRAWHKHGVRIFINEYIYQSFIKNVSPRIIFEITSSRFLSSVGKAISKVIPAFRANTFGVGVRFRSHEQWVGLFEEAGFRVVNRRFGENERISPPLRILMIKAIRRDSFLLEAV